MLDDPPTVGYDSDYIAAYAAETGCPERELWRAVLRQAGLDLSDSDPVIRQDAVEFFESGDLLQILDYAGISRAHAPWLRARALELAGVPAEQRQRHGRFITYRGQTRSLSGWAEATGVNVTTLCHRLRLGWTVARALSTPSQRKTAAAA